MPIRGEPNDPEPAPVLSLTCPACGATFRPTCCWSPVLFEIYHDELLERCPNCNVASRFTRGDYFLAPSAT